MRRPSGPLSPHGFPAFLAILAVSAAAWYPSLGGHFTRGWDDEWLLLANRTVHGFSARGVHDVFDPTIDRSRLGFEYLPVRDLSYMLDFEFWRLNPVGYRLGSLLVHAAAAYGVYLLLARLVGGRPGAALLGALVFALHPLASEPVAWIAGRKDALAVLFSIAAALALLAALDTARTPAGRRTRYAASLALAALALLSKSSAVGMLAASPLLVLLERPGRARAAAALPHVALAAIGAVVHVQVFRTGDVAEAGGPTLDRIATVGPAVLHALRSTAIPIGLAAHHPDPEPRGVLTAAVLAAATAAALVSIRRLLRSEPGLPVGRALAFALPWILVAMGPVLAPVPRRSAYLADRYGYPATIALAVLLAAGWAGSSRRPAARWLLALPVLLALGAISHQRASLWNSEVRLWRDAVEKDPRAPVARLNLADAYFRLRLPDQAEAEYRTCLELEPRFAKALRGLAVIHTLRGELDESQALLERAIDIDPMYVVARAELAGVLFESGDLEGAHRQIQAGLAIDPDMAAIWYYLGLVLAKERRADEARRAFDRALDLSPGDARILGARQSLEDR